MELNLKAKLYQNYGAFSKKYAEILTTALIAKNFTLSDLTKQTGYGFKMITTLINDFSYMFNFSENVYNLKQEFFKEIEGLNYESCLDNVNFNKIEEEVKRIKSSFTNHKPNIDHVACTPKTAIDRAIKLIKDFDVENCNILFLGDHDLTSVALKLLNSKANATVIDIDNDVLNAIDEFNEKNNANILTVFNDFVLPPPSTMENKFDVVFTDPPYTPEGMDLFIKRALFFMKKDITSTILCAYGSSELSPTIGYNVQKVFSNNFLYTDEILRKFNEYDAAEALGYRADLYIFRPTPNAWKKNKLTAIIQPNMYTHGVNSLESKKNFEEIVIKAYENSTSENKILLTYDSISKNIKHEKVLPFLFNSFNNKKVYSDVYVSLQNLFKYSYDQILLMLSADNIHLFINTDILNDGDKTTLLKQIFNIKLVDENLNVKHYLLTKKESSNTLLNFYNNKISKAINAFSNIRLENKTKNELRDVFNNSPISEYKDIQVQYIPTKKLILFNEFIKKLNW